MQRATLLIIALTFALATAPIEVSAQVPCGTSGGYCPSGQICTLAGLCDFSRSGGSSGARGLNTTLLATYAEQIVYFINAALVPLLIAIAFIVFLWGVFNYFIRGADDSEKRSEGRDFVLYGVIGFVIIFSIWGLVNAGVSILGLQTGGRPSSLPLPYLTP